MAIPSSFVVLYDTVTGPMLTNDCACPSALHLDQSVCNPAALVRRHPALESIWLDEDHVVAFVPSLSRVVVFNRAAFGFLDTLRTPLPVSAYEGEQAEAVALYYQLGLVCSDEPPPAPPPPETLIAWLHVTNACNLRCTYCYIDKTQEAMDVTTGLASIDAVLRAAQANRYRSVLLKYAGGEPSLNMPVIAEVHRYAQEQAGPLGIAVIGGVLSNGTGLTHYKLEQIRALNLRLMISLDGMQATHDQQRPSLSGHGSFKAVLAGIERALEHAIVPDISITVTGRNVAGLPDLLRWLLDRELPFSINFYRETDASRSFAELQLDEQQLISGMLAAYAAIAEQLPRQSVLGGLLDRTNLSAPHSRTCAVGENYLVIDHQGRVAKCQMEISQPVTTIHAPDPLALIRADEIGVRNIPVDQKVGCRSCRWRYWCAGGCAVSTFRATGRYDVQSPNCGIYQALYPHVIRLEGQRLLHYATQLSS